MVSDAPKRPRPWRVIAAELSNEINSNRILELSRELNHALKVQTSTSQGVRASTVPTEPSKKAAV